LFFATDIHGSEKCWMKLVNSGSFYEVDTVILGGDLTGKGVQVLLEDPPGVWNTNFLGEQIVIDNADGLTKAEAKIRNAGFYPYRVKPDEFTQFAASDERQEAVFKDLMIKTIQNWLEIADRKLKGSGQRILVTAGNDDPLFINDVFRGSSVVTMVERQVVMLDEHHEMINEGYSNPTPWHTHREMDEDSLYDVLKKQIEQVKDVHNAVFNLHVPPYNSKLDDAPMLDETLRPVDGGRTYIPVGSTAVRKVIETYQPLLGLHGHVHEAKGSTYIGKTLCINPGSNYTEGALAGYLISLDKKGVKAFQPIQG
jgi:Icc-related predicted phosphoesterase